LSYFLVFFPGGIWSVLVHASLFVNRNYTERPTQHPAVYTGTDFSPQAKLFFELELELIQTQMAQKPMLRAEVGMRVRCANKASAE
jgi:hypothetical protein